MTANPEPTPRRQPSWIIREGTPKDVSGILECRAAAFADLDLDKRDPRYWRWEFLANHAGPARLFVADHDGRIVGHYAVVPQRFLINGLKHAGSIVVDVMTHPDYQRQGMFTELGRYAIQHCTQDPRLEFTTGYPIRQEVIPGHLKVGWKIRFKIGTWVQVLSAARLLRSRAKAIRVIPGLATLLGFAPTIAARSWSLMCARDRSGIHVERLDAVASVRFDEFLARLHATLPAGCAIQERTTEFLRWRYDANPTRTYTYHLALGDSGAAVGLAVTRKVQLLGVQTLAIADLIVLDETYGRLDVVRTLIADIRRMALDRGAAMMAMMLTQPNPIVPSPWLFGFVPTPYRFSFITRQFMSHTAIDCDSLRWHLMWGDTDDV